MRASTISAIAAAIIAVVAAVSLPRPASAGGRENPDGFGLYSPDSRRRLSL